MFPHGHSATAAAIVGDRHSLSSLERSLRGFYTGEKTYLKIKQNVRKK
jgi:FKBP-type peptidyl-prolyl cis-trans isomerase 2